MTILTVLIMLLNFLIWVIFLFLMLSIILIKTLNIFLQGIPSHQPSNRPEDVQAHEDLRRAAGCCLHVPHAAGGAVRLASHLIQKLAMSIF